MTPIETGDPKLHWHSISQVLAKIADCKFGPLKVIEAGTEADILSSRTEDQKFQAEQVLRDALSERAVVMYYRDNSLDFQRKPIDATHLEDPSFWTYIVKLRRPTKRLLNPTLNQLADKIFEFPKSDIDEWLSETLSATGIRTPKKRKGRAPTYDQDFVNEEVCRLMDEHSDFDTRDPDWNCQAKLELEICIILTERHSKEPAPSTVRKLTKIGLRAWEDKRGR